MFSTAVFCAFALTLTPVARAWPIAIPVGSRAADDLLLNFDTSALAVPSQGTLTFFLMTSNVEAGDDLEIDLFGGLDGNDSMGAIYRGPFVSYQGNCAIGDPLCSALLDGSFSIGVRAATGNVQLVGAFVYVTGADGVPTSPVVATVGSAPPPPAPPAPPTVTPVAPLPVPAPAPAPAPPAVKPATTPTTVTSVDVIEYYHADWDQYFITAIPEEIARLDDGSVVGWARTGRQFKAYPLGASQGVTVCRFFSIAAAPRSSHFYTPFPTECATVMANADWLLEGNVFRIDVPASNGTCASGTVPVYRVYNNGQGGAPNHRYTVDASVRAQMIAQGWIPEGYGPSGVIMCAPQ